MIVIDTNVISEVVKVARNAQVVSWLDEQSAETLYLTSTSLAEIQLGLELLPRGKRKAALSKEVNALLSLYFEQRILSFDNEAAMNYGRLVAAARAIGHRVSIADAQIASIAVSRNFCVATRDTTPFVVMGLDVIDPWNLSAL